MVASHQGCNHSGVSGSLLVVVVTSDFSDFIFFIWLVQVLASFVVVVEEVHQIGSDINVIRLEEDLASELLVWTLDDFKELGVGHASEGNFKAPGSGYGDGENGMSPLIHLVGGEIVVAELLELELIFGRLGVTIRKLHEL